MSLLLPSHTTGHAGRIRRFKELRMERLTGALRAVQSTLPGARRASRRVPTPTTSGRRDRLPSALTTRERPEHVRHEMQSDLVSTV
jgi:hypothetical protein